MGNGTGRVDLNDYDSFRALVCGAMGGVRASSIRALCEEVTAQNPTLDRRDVEEAYRRHSVTARSRSDTGWLWQDRPNLVPLADDAVRPRGRGGEVVAPRRKSVRGGTRLSSRQREVLTQESPLRGLSGIGSRPLPRMTSGSVLSPGLVKPSNATHVVRPVAPITQQQSVRQTKGSFLTDLPELPERCCEGYEVLRTSAKEEHPKGGWLVCRASGVLREQFGKRIGNAIFMRLRSAGWLTTEEGRKKQGGSPRTYWLRIVPVPEVVGKQTEPRMESSDAVGETKDFPAGLPGDRREAYAVLRAAAKEEHPEGGWVVPKALGVLVGKFGRKGFSTHYSWLKANGWLTSEETGNTEGSRGKDHWLRNVPVPKAAGKRAKSKDASPQNVGVCKEVKDFPADLPEKYREAYKVLRTAAQGEHPEGGWLVRGACEVLCRQFGQKNGFSLFCSLKRASLLTIQEGRHGRGGSPRIFWLKIIPVSRVGVSQDKTKKPATTTTRQERISAMTVELKALLQRGGEIIVALEAEMVDSDKQ